MFDQLSESLQRTFKNLRGYGKLSEDNVKEALREVRLALLEADVNFQVTKDFIARVKEKALGEEVLTSVTPGQQFTKRIHEELVDLLGGDHRGFDLNQQPAQILMLGLHGVGKTTTCGKLARRWREAGKKVLLVACDIRRPAAVDQLRILAEQAGVDVVTPEPGETVPEIGARAKDRAIRQWYDIVIYDTGGRFAIDEELVGELKELRVAVDPRNVVLVIDAATGQESVHVAEAFNEALGLTGLVLTKLDGDARGGAALSVQAVTGCPVHLVGVGEKQEDLQDFHPDRLASRILGMGDVVGLVERAQANVDEKQAQQLEEKMVKGTMTLDDLLLQMQQMKKMGSMTDLMEMMPGMPKMDAAKKQQLAAFSEKKTRRFEAIIQSMTPRERKRPKLVLNASRKRRIARGSGTEVREINELLKQYEQTMKMSRNMKKWQKRLLKLGR